MKQSRLSRGEPLKSRTRLKPMSAKRAAQLPAQRAEREEVFRRDGGCVFKDVPEAGRCFGRLTFGHLRKASQGGKYSADNGAAMCVYHNDLIESDADFAALAHRLGYLKLRGDV